MNKQTLQAVKARSGRDDRDDTYDRIHHVDDVGITYFKGDHVIVDGVECYSNFGARPV